MASKYDEFWTKVFEEAGTEDVFASLSKEGKVVLPLCGLTDLGSRGHWYGNDTFTSEGKIGTGINAHVTALKRIIPQHLVEGQKVKATVSVKGDKLTLTEV